MSNLPAEEFVSRVFTVSVVNKIDIQTNSANFSLFTFCFNPKQCQNVIPECMQNVFSLVLNLLLSDCVCLAVLIFRCSIMSWYLFVSNYFILNRWQQLILCYKSLGPKVFFQLICAANPLSQLICGVQVRLRPAAVCCKAPSCVKRTY